MVNAAAMVVVGAVASWLDLVTADAERGLPDDLISYGWVAALTGLPPIILGALLVRGRPRHAVGWALTAFGWVWLIDVLAIEWSSYGALVAPDAPVVGLADWFAGRFGAWLLPLLALVGVIFPDGRLPAGRWWRWGTVSAMAVTAILPAALMVAPLAVLTDIGPRSPEFDTISIDLIVLPLPAEVWRPIIEVGQVTLVGSLLVPLAVTVRRYRQNGAESRAQLRWLMWAVLMSVLVLVGTLRLPAPWDELSFLISVLLICTAIAMAVTRHRLYDIDRLLPGTLVYAAMAGAFLLTDMVMIAVAGRLLGERDAALLAMALVAVLYTVARDWLWRLARRLLLGVRPDAQTAVAVLARQLELAAGTDEQLRNLAQTVARELRMPYVRVEVDHGTGGRVAATHGRPTAHLVDLPVAYRGRRIGRLVLGTRRRRGLREGDQALLGDLVRQAAAAARATDEAASLRRARVALVTAREEERRRLRRDLHDGLGPTIAAAAMQLKAARGVTASRPADADRLLAAAIKTLGTLMEDVRSLVYGMRPPALDELGLMAALSPKLDALRNAGIVVTVDAADPRPHLPAAWEVAAYRIVVEALTNVARHAAARRCHIVVRVVDGQEPDSGGNALELIIRDDGRGIPASAPTGVGMMSMRERAAELGGDLQVSPASGGGTEVRFLLPYVALPAELPTDA